METALKSQLNKLKLSQKSQAILPSKSEASFLFDLEHSKRIDMDTIYEIGYSGLIDLARHKQNFVKYFNSLFNSTSKYFNREVKKIDELKLVDEDINELLVQLIPYFRHKPTHRILEYMVRIFNINVYNKKMLLFSFLPYHETKLFTKLIQIMNLEQFNHLRFFSSFSKGGTVVLKESLYKELGSNFDFLKEIFNFYEEYVLTNNTVELDDTAYFNFIFEICEHLLRNSAKVLVDVNRLNLIIQFLNKIFKFFKNKMAVFNKATSDDEGEYENTLVSNLCGLVNTLITKLSISSEYKKAILNDLVNKMLINLDSQASIENILRTILTILNESTSTSKNQTPNAILLGKETLSNLEEFYSNRKNSRQILRNISNSDSFDLTLLIKTILLSSQEHMTLVKNLIRDNNFKEENLQKLIQFLYDHLIANRNSDYSQLLNYIEEIHSEMFNSILVILFTNTKDKNYVAKLQEVTKEINDDFQKLLSKKDSNADNAEINAFNLFLNLNQTNVNTTLASIRKIDDILDLKDADQKDFLMKKIVPSLTNKFSSLDKEIILNQIVDLKHLPELLSNYALFRQEYLNFFFTVNTRQIDLYSPEFLEKYVKSLVTHLIDEKDSSSLKVIVYLVLFKFNADEKLFGLNTFTKRLFTSVSDFDSFVNYLCSHSNENINSIKFMEVIKELLVDLKLNKGSKFNSNLMFDLFEKILLKEKEKLIFLKTTFYQQLEITVDILKLDFFKSQEAEYFNHLSTLFINVIKSVPNMSELYENEKVIRKIINKYSVLLLSASNFTEYENFTQSIFKSSENIQKFTTYTILSSNNLNENFYQYLKNKISCWDFAEASLISALIYALSISRDFKSSTSIIDIIRELSSKRLHTTNFNIFSESSESQFALDEASSNAFINMVDELLSRKNEILSNNANVKKFIATEMNEDNLEAIFLTFVKDTNSLNIKSVSKIIELFSSLNKNSNKKSQAKNLQLVNISREFVATLTTGNSAVLQNETDYQDFIHLAQLIFENLMNSYPKSSLQIIEIILSISSKFKFDQAFIEKLFSKENFEVSAEIKCNLPQLHQIIKLAMSYSVSPDSFTTSDDQFCINLLNYIKEGNLILNRENEFFIFYAFEIIFKSKNYYFDISYIKSTAELLYTINIEKEGASSESNSVYLNLSNNLLTIITNSTIESEQKPELKSIIDKLEQTIFFLVKKFRGANIEDSHSLELAHVMNTLFLCINKLIALFDFINEEKEFVKNLIMRCLEILNEKSFKENDEDVIMTDLTQKTKEEVYLVFLNAIKNFIELVFSKQNSKSASSNGQNSEHDSNSIFYEYIHYFVKFSILNLKDEKILKMFLTNFLQIPMISSNENFLACYFVDLYYFTIEMNQEGVAHDNLYSEIIFNFFKGDEDDSKIKTQMPKSLKVIQSIFEELNSNRDNIFCLEQEDEKVRPDPNFIALNLISKIFILIEDNFGYLEKSDDTPFLNTILKICSAINMNRRITTGKMRNNEDSSNVRNEIFKIHLKELKSFEKQLFSALNESKVIYNAILFIYQDKEEESKNLRGYLLNKFYEMIITKENFDSVNVSNLFEFFITSLRKEDKVENLQLIFSILTKITTEKEAKEVFKLLKSDNNFDYILSLVKFSNGENNKNLQTQFYHFSILVFLTKIFNILPQNKFLDKFNPFLKTFLKGFDVVLAIDNEDLTILILETFDYLSQHKSEFYSPYLNEILYKILSITSKIKSKQTNSNSSKILNLVNKTFETIAKKQLFDNSFKSVKYCIDSLTKSKEQFEAETYKIIFNFFKTSIEQIDRVVMADVYEKIFKFIVKLLIDEKMNHKLSEYILDCFRTYVLKINEKQLRTIFQNILIFGKEKSEGETSLKYKLENSIVTFQILNTILQAVTVVFVPYFEKYKGYWTDLVNSVCSLFSSEDKRNSNKKKKDRIDFDECYDDAGRTFSYLKLNSLLLENIKFVFKFNKENSLLNETIEDLSESLMGQLKFIFFESDEEKYLSYFDKEIKACFLEIFKNLRSDDHLKEFNDSILNLIREDHYLIKLLALKMIFALFQELKERYITLLSNILPYVSECLEDSNEKVHQEAFKIMKYVEKETGEDLKYYLEG